MKKLTALTKALERETDLRTYSRLVAVHGVLVDGRPTMKMAEELDVTQRVIQMWVKRFREGGVDSLRDAPGRGRIPTIPYDVIDKAALRLTKKRRLTPHNLSVELNRTTKKSYSLGNIRKLLYMLGYYCDRTALEHDSKNKRLWLWNKRAEGTQSNPK